MISWKVVTPPKPDIRRAEKIMRDEMKRFATIAEAEGNKLTAYWKEPIVFTAVVRAERGFYTIKLRTKANKKQQQKFEWLDKGTKDHVIRAKNAKALKIPGVRMIGGSRPNSLITTRSTKKKVGKDIFVKSAKVSGIKPRNWTKLLEQKLQPKLLQSVNLAITELAKYYNGRK